MLIQLFSVFLDVVLPVVGIVTLGFYFGPRLKLEARTLSRSAFYIFVPVFIYQIIAKSHLDLNQSARMAGFILASHLGFGFLGFIAAKLLGCDRKMTGAFIMMALFGNVGNFGLAIIKFGLGEGGLEPAAIYFLMINIVAFGGCVAVASWARGKGGSPLLSVLKTPALMAIIPGVIVSVYQIELPTAPARMIELMRDAVIPMMLFTLGVQLSEAKTLKVTREGIAASFIKLVASPLLAMSIIGLFGIEGVSRSAGVLQCGMPVAVLVSIVAIEYEVAPIFVTSTVFLSTLLSLPTLTVLLYIL